jgi:hypothetical protein
MQVPCYTDTVLHDRVSDRCTCVMDGAAKWLCAVLFLSMSMLVESSRTTTGARQEPSRVKGLRRSLLCTSTTRHIHRVIFSHYLQPFMSLLLQRSPNIPGHRLLFQSLCLATLHHGGRASTISPSIPSPPSPPLLLLLPKPHPTIHLNLVLVIPRISLKVRLPSRASGFAGRYRGVWRPSTLHRRGMAEV